MPHGDGDQQRRYFTRSSAARLRNEIARTTARRLGARGLPRGPMRPVRRSFGVTERYNPNGDVSNYLFVVDVDPYSGGSSRNSSPSQTEEPIAIDDYYRRPDIAMAVRILEENVMNLRYLYGTEGFRGFRPSEIRTRLMPDPPTIRPQPPPIVRPPTSAEDCQRLKLTEELKEEAAVCVICTEVMSVSDHIWPCNSCFNIFHLKCIRRWAKISRDSDSDGSWICPVCRRAKYVTPNRLSYRCFCGRVHKPKPIEGVTPHSCGGQCMRNCGTLCHPGPC